MAKGSKSQYPDDYGVVLPNTLPNILTPLSTDNEGDELVPPNDMKGVAPQFTKGGSLHDPLGLISPISKDGTKG